ncbi:MAG: PKD domain-containing protein [Bacteroidota bacterium]
MKHLLTFFAVVAGFIGFSQTAIITSPDVSICLGETAQLSSCTSVAGSSPIVNSIWSVIGPDGTLQGNSAPCVNFTFVPTTTGTYDVSLINQHQNGTTSQTQSAAFITVNAGVTADIGASVTSCNVPFGVQYNIGGSTPDQPGMTYSWAFQSGTPATFSGTTPPLITYTTPNSYNVTLTVTNTLTGCTDTEVRTMNVQNYVADMIVPAEACEGIAVPVQDNSTVGVNSWNWTVTPGLGVTGTGSISGNGTPNPSITFSGPGQYTIDLTSSNTAVPCNGVAVSQTITILPKPDPSFTATPLVGCAPLAVTITNTTASPAGATFVWSYGDGTADFTGQNSPVHTYMGNGSFTPSVVMTGSNGCSASFSEPTVVLTSPVAHFSTSVKDGCEGINVNFTDLSIVPAPIVSWLWQFSDGTTSNVQNPVKTFTCGEYNATLTITIQGGCSATVSLDDNNAGTQIFDTGTGFTTLSNGGAGFADTVLRFGTHTTPDFFVDHHNDCIKAPFEITDITQINCPHDPSDISRQWFLNMIPDGTDSVLVKIFTDTMQNIGPNMLPGTDIALSINFRGCRDTTFTVDSIYISAPISKFSIPTVLFCDVNQQPFPLSKTITIDDAQSIYGHQWMNNTIPLNPLILDSNIANLAFDDVVVTYRWDDGTSDLVEDTDSFLQDADKGASVDPALATAQTTTVPVTHTFTDYGTYEVWQIIENRTLGCKDSTSLTVNVSWVSTDYVFDEPNVPDNDQDSVCLGAPYGMIQTSSTHSTHGPLSYSFSNGISGADPQTTFPSTGGPAGVQNIILTTTNSVGCSATANGTLTVFALPLASFTLNDMEGCVGEPYVSTATNTSTHDPLGFTLGNNTTGWASSNAFSWTFNNTDGVTTTNYNQSVPTTVTVNTTVTLVATDAFGCVSNPFSLQAIVQQPTAAVNLTSQICNSDISTGLISSTSNGNISQYTWIIDGVQAPASGISSFPFPGTWSIPEGGPTSTNHTVGLIVEDVNGCRDTLDPIQSVTILSPKAGFIETARQGTAVAGQTNTFNCPPVIISFADDSETANSSPIVNWNWYFNTFNPNAPFPGTLTTTQENPQGIQYLFAGAYDLTFVVQDAAGCRDTLYIDDYLVIQGPSGEPQVTTTLDACGQTFSFDLTNTTNTTSWSWNLGDGTVVSSADSIPPFTYTYSGVQSYFPVVTLFDDQGCGVPYRDTAIVFPNGVTAQFSASPDEVNLGTTVTFTDASSAVNGISMWIWDFGNGNIDTLTTAANPTQQYATGGEIPVILKVVEAGTGCTDDYQVILDIDVKFDMPNVFTGLGSDGPNADLNIFADVFNDFEILLVNRWGNVVYEGKRDPSKPRYLWNGIDMKSGKLCQDGTYFYRLKGTLKNDVEVDLNGFVTLIATKRP